MNVYIRKGLIPDQPLELHALQDHLPAVKASLSGEIGWYWSDQR